MDCQSLGGLFPRPGLKMNRLRSGEPGPALTAWTNQSCWSEPWLGTMSMMVRMFSACAAAMYSSASSSVPNAGSMAR
jgi:hypothetical protein